MSILQRQFISDNQGIPIGIILPLEEYRLVEPILKQHTEAKNNEIDKIQQMKQAVHDSRFMTDLHEVMSDFAIVDSEWWESNE
jgi:hypothetical protein